MSHERAPREKPRGQKADLYKWVNDQQQLDMRTKYILEKLADYAQPDCTSWSPVATLAYAANCSERTVQYHLRALQAAGLIEWTGRSHRLDDSTRSVPVYQLAPKVEGLGARPGMGAKIAPIAPASVQSGGAMGATGLHPVMEIQETLSGANAPSPGAGAGEIAEFEQLEAAAPRSLLKYADRDAAFAAFVALGRQGVGLERLAACARRMAADPAFRSKKYPPKLEDWLGKGQWRGWDGDDAAGVDPPAPAPRIGNVPDWLREAFAEAGADGGQLGSYLDPCDFEGPARLMARTGTARDWLARTVRADAALRALGLVVDVKGRP